MTLACKCATASKSSCGIWQSRDTRAAELIRWCADCRTEASSLAISNTLLQALPHGLRLDVALLHPVIVTSRLIAHSRLDSAVEGSAATDALSSAVSEQIVRCADAARQSGNPGLAGRLLQHHSHASAATGAQKRSPLRLDVARAEVAWAEASLEAGRLEAAEQLAAGLRAASAASDAGSSAREVRARGWLLLHSWLPELEAAPSVVDRLLSEFCLSIPASDVAAESHEQHEQLAALDDLQLTPAQRMSALCLRAAIASDEHSSQAWRALGIWLSGIIEASSNSGDGAGAGHAPASEAADLSSRDARCMALLAYCRSLRAAGLSQVWSEGNFGILSFDDCVLSCQTYSDTFGSTNEVGVSSA